MKMAGTGRQQSDRDHHALLLASPMLQTSRRGTRKESVGMTNMSWLQMKLQIQIQKSLTDVDLSTEGGLVRPKKGTLPTLMAKGLKRQ